MGWVRVFSCGGAVAAPFCMLVDDDLLRQLAEFRGIGRRKTFQESPRKVTCQYVGAPPTTAVAHMSDIHVTYDNHMRRSLIKWGLGLGSVDRRHKQIDTG